MSNNIHEPVYFAIKHCILGIITNKIVYIISIKKAGKNRLNLFINHLLDKKVRYYQFQVVVRN